MKQQIETITRNFSSSFANASMDPIDGIRTSVSGGNAPTRTGARIGSAVGVAGSLAGAGVRGVQVGTKLLNPSINITQKGLAHVVERHTVNGIKNTGASIFNAGEDVTDLIKQGTQQVMSGQRNGNFQRVVNVGRNIGTYRGTGEQTSMMTIITNAKNALITAFPGTP